MVPLFSRGPLPPSTLLPNSKARKIATNMKTMAHHRGEVLMRVTIRQGLTRGATRRLFRFQRDTLPK